MPVGVIRVEILIPQARSLKEKRSPLLSLKERLRSRLGASVAEVDHQDLHGRSALEVALAGRDSETAAGLLDKAEEMIRGARDVQVVELRRETIGASELPESWA